MRVAVAGDHGVASLRSGKRLELVLQTQRSRPLGELIALPRRERAGSLHELDLNVAAETCEQVQPGHPEALILLGRGEQRRQVDVVSPADCEDLELGAI